MFSRERSSTSFWTSTCYARQRSTNNLQRMGCQTDFQVLLRDEIFCISNYTRREEYTVISRSMKGRSHEKLLTFLCRAPVTCRNSAMHPGTAEGLEHFFPVHFFCFSRKTVTKEHWIPGSTGSTALFSVTPCARSTEGNARDALIWVPGHSPAGMMCWPKTKL